MFVHCYIVDHLSDIDWLPSDDTDDDDDDDDGDELLVDNNRPAADTDDVPSIDVQDSPVVSAGIMQVTQILPPACASQVCR